MGIVKAIIGFRLIVDTEYQGWILVFVTLAAAWCYCLPCTCAGSQWGSARRFANTLQRRLPYYLLFATFVNALLLFLVITWLPDWGYGDYVKCVAQAGLYAAKHAMKSMVSIAIIVVFVFVFAFKDKFMKVLGIDHKTLFRFKVRDVFDPLGSSTRPIAVTLFKVDNLPAAQIWSPNNVFIEVNLGYNEPMKTRVHNNAGSACSLKETIQLNFDDQEEEEPLYIFVKNQKVMGSGELGRLELKAEDVARIEKESIELSKQYAGQWTEAAFVKERLMPKGEIYLRVAPVDDA